MSSLPFPEKYRGLQQLPLPITRPVRQPPLPLPMARSLLAVAEFHFRAGEYDTVIRELSPLMECDWQPDDFQRARRIRQLLSLAYVRRFNPDQAGSVHFPPLRFAEQLAENGYADLAHSYVELIARKGMGRRRSPEVRRYLRCVDRLFVEFHAVCD